MDVGRINPARVGNTDVKLDKPRAKSVKKPGDVFVKSSGEKPEPSMENIAGNFSAKDAGSMVLRDSKVIRAAFSGTIIDTKWKAEGGLSYQTALIYNRKHNQLYGGVENTPVTPGHIHRLTCYKPDGTVLWKYEDEEFRGGLAVDREGNAYFCGTDSLTAVNKDGKKLWSVASHVDGKYKAMYTFSNPVLSDDGTVYVQSRNSDENNSHALSTVTAVKDGEVKWTYDLYASAPGRHNTLVTGKDGTIYLAGRKDVVEKGFISLMDKHHDENFLIALDPDGKEKFSIPVKSWGSDNEGNLEIGPDGSLITIQNNRDLVVYTPDGKEKFSKQILGPGITKEREFSYETDYPPVVDGEGNIYFTGKNVKTKALICLDKNGEEKWRHYTDTHFTVQPHVMPDGNVSIAKSDEKIYIFDKKGNVVKKFFTGGLDSLRSHGRIKGEKSCVMNRFDFDDKGTIYANSGSWILAFDGNAEPLSQIDEEVTNLAANDNKSIKVEEKKVVIGGVELPVKKRS